MTNNYIKERLLAYKADRQAVNLHIKAIENYLKESKKAQKYKNSIKVWSDKAKGIYSFTWENREKRKK